MSYVTADWYKKTYQSNSIPDDELQGILDRASMDVDTLTRMKIKKLGGFECLSEFEKTRVRLAVCAQAEHLYTKSSLSGVSSYSIGDVSVTIDEASEVYDKGCVQYLSATRLMYRGL